MGALHRRTFLGAAAGAALASAQPRVPIVDCHIHLFDQARPQGAPYTGGSINKEPALPARYRKLARPLGIVAAIEVEASPWVEDNLWVLETEERDPMMVGAIGNLQPEKAEFREYLDRYRKNRLFLGIRYGNLWGYDLAAQLSNPAFVEGLRLLQQADMVLDTANPRSDLLDAILRLSDKVPGLRIVIDHLPSMLLADLDRGARSSIDRTLRELSRRPKIYIKISQAIRIVNGVAVTAAATYKPAFDQIFDTFGENRLLFGSDWPNEHAVDNLPAIVQIVREYFAAKGAAAAEKYFWKNSLAVYKWKRRDPSQPRI